MDLETAIMQCILVAALLAFYFTHLRDDNDDDE